QPASPDVEGHPGPTVRRCDRHLDRPVVGSNTLGVVASLPIGGDGGSTEEMVRDS
ncbi:hypothetical protein Dimus_012595, partial [Dionaea muscipula]